MDDLDKIRKVFFDQNIKLMEVANKEQDYPNGWVTTGWRVVATRNDAEQIANAPTLEEALLDLKRRLLL